ncbi:MAG TPA: NAD(P)H-dependent oxidoreductase [Syntrophorhabdaceae bacterium]|jgi:multimeric flavodoxin WrbA
MKSKPAVRILVTYHSQSGNTAQLAGAVARGVAETEGVTAIFKRAAATVAVDIRECDGLVICSPEYFGYMAGAIKDLFDRTYETLRDDFRMNKKPYALVICAGNDGTGALTQIERILKAYRVKKAQHPIICKGPVTEEIILRAVELGKTMAEGVKMGIF